LIISAFCFAIPFQVSAEPYDTSLPAAGLDTTLQDFSQLSNSNKNMLLSVSGMPQDVGFDWPKTVAILIFNGIGFIAFVYGKKNAAWKPMVLGILLIGYPYVITGAVAVYAVGVVLTAALYFWRD